MSVDGKRWKTLGVPEKQDRTGLDCWEIRFSWKADRNDCFKISIRKLPLSIMKPKGQQSLYAENRGFFCFHLVLEKGWFGQPKYCTFFQLYCSLWTSRSFPLLFLDVFIWSLSHKRGGRSRRVLVLLAYEQALLWFARSAEREFQAERGTRGLEKPKQESLLAGRDKLNTRLNNDARACCQLGYGLHRLFCAKKVRADLFLKSLLAAQIYLKPFGYSIISHLRMCSFQSHSQPSTCIRVKCRLVYLFF